MVQPSLSSTTRVGRSETKGSMVTTRPFVGRVESRGLVGVCNNGRNLTDAAEKVLGGEHFADFIEILFKG